MRHWARCELVLTLLLAAPVLLATGCSIPNPRLPSHEVIQARLAAGGYRLVKSSPQEPNPKLVSFHWRKVQRFRYRNFEDVDLLCDPKNHSKVLGIHTDFTLYNQSDEGRAHYKRFRRFVRDMTGMDADEIPMRPYGLPSLFSAQEKGSVKRNGLRLECCEVRSAGECTRYEFFLSDARW